MQTAGEAFKTRQQTSSTESKPSSNPQRLQYATQRAKVMFGCYRRGDANDPDTYVAAVSAVLARYEPAVIEIVTDPYSGLPSRKKNGYSGLPDVADVKEACEAEATRRARYAELGAAKPRPFLRLMKPRTQGMRANVLVLNEAPQYPIMVGLAEAKDADFLDWKWDEEGRGIWVALPWLDKAPRRFVARTDGA